LTISALTDQGQIVKQMIDAENARMHTGVRVDTANIETTTQRVMQFPKHKNVLEGIRDMALAWDGFDYDASPVEDDDDLDVMADLQIWSQRGIEYAEGQRNVLTADIENHTDRITTNQWVTGRETGTVLPAKNYQDTDMEDTYNAVFDSVDSFTDISEGALLEFLAQQFQIWRSAPRQVVKFVPAPTARFRPFDHFDLGDFVTFRLRKGRYASRPIDGAVRMYGFTIDIDETGAERIAEIEIEPNDQGGGA
jgi:hypothetical protein